MSSETQNLFVEAQVGVFSEEVLKERIVTISLNKTSVSSLPTVRSREGKQTWMRSFLRSVVLPNKYANFGLHSTVSHAPFLAIADKVNACIDQRISNRSWQFCTSRRANPEVFR